MHNLERGTGSWNGRRDRCTDGKGEAVLSHPTLHAQAKAKLGHSEIAAVCLTSGLSAVSVYLRCWSSSALQLHIRCQEMKNITRRSLAGTSVMQLALGNLSLFPTDFKKLWIIIVISLDGTMLSQKGTNSCSAAGAAYILSNDMSQLDLLSASWTAIWLWV